MSLNIKPMKENFIHSSQTTPYNTFFLNCKFNFKIKSKQILLRFFVTTINEIDNIIWHFVDASCTYGSTHSFSLTIIV